MMRRTFSLLLEAYGEQHGWPAESPFEVMVGAILVQDFKHEQGAEAIARIKAEADLTPETLIDSSVVQWTAWMYPLGNVTEADEALLNNAVERLQQFARWYLEQGRFEALSKLDTVDLREKLLSVQGMKPELADTILLYAFERAVFVVDDDTRRLFFRLGFINGTEPYEDLRHVIEVIMDLDVEIYNEYHALIAHHAQMHCRIEANCTGCPLDAICPNEE